MTGANPIAAEESPKIFCLPPRTSGQLAFKNNGQTTPESIRKVLPDVIFPSDELVRVEDGIAYLSIPPGSGRMNLEVRGQQIAESLISAGIDPALVKFREDPEYATICGREFARRRATEEAAPGKKEPSSTDIRPVLTSSSTPRSARMSIANFRKWAGIFFPQQYSSPSNQPERTIVGDFNRAAWGLVEENFLGAVSGEGSLLRALVYGPLGSGKSTIGDRACQEAVKNKPNKPILFCAGEDLKTAYSYAATSGLMADFSRGLDGLEGLVIDDIGDIKSPGTAGRLVKFLRSKPRVPVLVTSAKLPVLVEGILGESGEDTPQIELLKLLSLFTPISLEGCSADDCKRIAETRLDTRLLETVKAPFYQALEPTKYRVFLDQTARGIATTVYRDDRRVLPSDVTALVERIVGAIKQRGQLLGTEDVQKVLGGEYSLGESPAHSMVSPSHYRAAKPLTLDDISRAVALVTSKQKGPYRGAGLTRDLTAYFAENNGVSSSQFQERFGGCMATGSKRIWRQKSPGQTGRKAEAIRRLVGDIEANLYSTSQQTTENP